MLDYQFNDEGLLKQALTHRSFALIHNERLEFLGDSILNFTIAEALYHQFPSAAEGDLSRLRAALVKGETLADIARELELGRYMYLGEGELKSGGQARASILADVFEAIIGAIYLDGGLESARGFILARFARRLEAVSLETHAKDPKTQLQEWLQARQQPLPRYEVVAIAGEAHCQQFTVACYTNAVSQPTHASASSRRAAEKKAAEQMLNLLEDKARG